VRACHDCSEGGLAVAVAEMAFAGGLGVKVSLPTSDNDVRDDILLFSESNSRFIVEVKSEQQAEFEKILNDVPFAEIGAVVTEPSVNIFNRSHEILINETCANLKESWQQTLRW
jgi:phosphoribosylformylglycinamidine synthase